jgi:hypothetical protein
MSTPRPMTRNEGAAYCWVMGELMLPLGARGHWASVHGGCTRALIRRPAHAAAAGRDRVSAASPLLPRQIPLCTFFRIGGPCVP